MKAVVFTLGCKVNSYESSSLMRGLAELGYEVSSKLSPADLYIINTCAVTKEAERKSRQAIARVKKCSPHAKIIVTGCASQKDPQSFISKDGVYLVTGAINKDKIIDIIGTSGVAIETDETYYHKFYPYVAEKTRYFIKIQDGCNNFCSYCVIPYLRGSSRSRRVEDILKELSLVEPLEVVLTGINVSAYDDNGKKLPYLINALADYPARIRLGSLEDNVVSDELITALKNLKDFAPHFHLSLQSGSDKVLKEMNRRYDSATFLKSVETIRKAFPDAAITTDVIAGYSTETDDDFEKTYSLCEKVAFADIHCFEYSRRDGTVGYDLPPLPPEVKQSRLKRLLTLKQKLKTAFTEKFIGKTLSFIPERYAGGYTEGYTGNYIRVYVPQKLALGGAKLVCLKELYEDGALAESVE